MPTPTKILVLVLIVAFSQGQPLDIGDNDYGNFTQFSNSRKSSKFRQIAVYVLIYIVTKIFSREK